MYILKLNFFLINIIYSIFYLYDRNIGFVNEVDTFLFCKYFLLYIVIYLVFAWASVKG